MKCVAANCAASAASGMSFWKDPYYMYIHIHIYIYLRDDEVC